jgi:hypothetical protein
MDELTFCANCDRSVASTLQYCDECGTWQKAQPINCGIWSEMPQGDSFVHSVSDVRKIWRNLRPSQEFSFGCLAIVMLYIVTAMSIPDQPSGKDASTAAFGCRGLRQQWKSPFTQDELDLLNACEQASRPGDNLRGELVSR